MIAILQYNAGNIASVKNAVERLDFECVVTDDKHEIRRADKVIFPGVGEARSAMQYLVEKQLDQCIKSLEQPVLGICLGQQLLCSHSEEGDTDCMGVFDALVKRFPPNGIVPHMGWNNVHGMSKLFEGVLEEDNVYFVHSYYAEISQHTSAVCDYMLPFSAAMQKDNFFATQFHPEKSAGVGAQVLLNFLSL